MAARMVHTPYRCQRQRYARTTHGANAACNRRPWHPTTPTPMPRTPHSRRQRRVFHRRLRHPTTPTPTLRTHHAWRQRCVSPTPMAPHDANTKCRARTTHGSNAVCHRRPWHPTAPLNPSCQSTRQRLRGEGSMSGSPTAGVSRYVSCYLSIYYIQHTKH